MNMGTIDMINDSSKNATNMNNIDHLKLVERIDSTRRQIANVLTDMQRMHFTVYEQMVEMLHDYENKCLILYTINFLKENPQFLRDPFDDLD